MSATLNLGRSPRVVRELSEIWKPWAIEEEPMLFQADAHFASRHVGGITSVVLWLLHEEVGADFWRLRIDTRVHMLMPGWYPCIPGWHCDFMVANADGSQQHDPERDTAVRHFAYVSGGPAMEFLGARGVPLPMGQVRWGDVDRHLEQTAHLRRLPMPQRTLVEFNATELHRGTQWRGEPGHWRYFFRASLFPKGHPYAGKFANKIRRQTQVYCDVHEGW